MTSERLSYGDHPDQWGQLHRPAGPSRGVVVVVHGGFWKAQYDASLGAPLVEDLARRGWTAWNLEYRRVGAGGGWPTTFDDVAAGIDRLAEVGDVELGSVVAMGHSAGGHLALWAAARDRFEPWAPVRVPVSGVVSQAGVVDLAAAYAEDLGAGAVGRLMSGPPGPAYDAVDPRRQVPLGVPVVCVHAPADDEVPLRQSQEYVAATRAAGGTAELVEATGDHYTLIDPEHADWELCVRAVEKLTPTR